MRFTTTHTQPSAVKRELIPLRQDHVLLLCKMLSHSAHWALVLWLPETSAFSNGPNLNFWRSSHSPQVAAHLPPWSSDSPAPPRPCWTRNTTSHVQFREERKLLLWLLWSLGVNQLVTRRARLTQEFGRVARRTNCSGRTCFASFTPAMCPASTQVAWRRA